MKIFNTYSSSLEEFVPINPNLLTIYVCGPTVYNYIHIGNTRPMVFFDSVRRFFETEGYRVKFASNFTDVDDKIIQKAKDEGASETEVAARFIQAYLEDMKRLNCRTDYIMPKVTEYMPHIIHYIENLVKEGYAYVVDGDVYFRVSKIADYGHLSNQNLDDLIAGARIEVNEKKESPLDFTLWKKTTNGVAWESDFSKGRPGWHTECVAMIDDIFGGEIDIHGGGADLVFPHHENEIAQAEASCHNHLAHYWMHNGWLNLEGEKMSKSLGNVVHVKDLPGNPLAFRMFLLATHYRSPLNFSLSNLEVYQQEYAKTENTIRLLFSKSQLEGFEPTPLFAFQNAHHTDAVPHEFLATIQDGKVSAILHEYMEAMESDFNTPNAITALFSLIKEINIMLRKKPDKAIWGQALDATLIMTGILGIRPALTPLSDKDINLYREWEQARLDKDFAKADTIRPILQEKGLL